LIELYISSLIERISSPLSLRKSVRKRCLINTANNLLKKYKERKIFKPVYAIFSRESGADAVRIQQLIEQFTKPDERLKFQHWLEDMIGLDEGSIIMYVTEKDKGKDAFTKVLWVNSNIKSLKDIEEDEIIKDFTSTLSKRYSKLWRLYVFVDGYKVVDYGTKIAGYCRTKLFPSNDIENEDSSQAPTLDAVDLYIQCHHRDECVSETEKDQIRAEISTRPLGTYSMNPRHIYDEIWTIVRGEHSK